MEAVDWAVLDHLVRVRGEQSWSGGSILNEVNCRRASLDLQFHLQPRIPGAYPLCCLLAVGTSAGRAVHEIIIIAPPGAVILVYVAPKVAPLPRPELVFVVPYWPVVVPNRVRPCESDGCIDVTLDVGVVLAGSVRRHKVPAHDDLDGEPLHADASPNVALRGEAQVLSKHHAPPTVLQTLIEGLTGPATTSATSIVRSDAVCCIVRQFSPLRLPLRAQLAVCGAPLIALIVSACVIKAVYPVKVPARHIEALTC
mmetsp:Transcript_26456/g.70209  ORF Transcript_26456/g.70209 Transcript_26456/m.70209 type:complete len:255 (+) Transcript_26456:188-952(+)